jgi:predicted dehydrogenase
VSVEPLAAEIESRWGAAPKRHYGVAIIGCGRIARAHAAALSAHPAAELVALCDVSEEGLRAFGQQHGVSPDGQFTDHEELFDSVHPDVVHVCTWPDTHERITRTAAERGIHVYSEKPMALDLQQADRMLAACRAAGVVLGVNHHRRGDSRFIRAKKLIQEGGIGDLRLLVGDHGGGGRRLMAMSTHLYDLYRYLAGDAAWASGHVMKEGRAALPEDVYEEPHEGLAAGDEVSVQFGFASGAYAYHDGLGHVDVEVAGTHGRMLFHEGVARKPWPFGAAHAAWAQYPEGDGGRQAKGGPDAWRPLDGVPESELNAPNHAYGRMIDRFLRAVDSRVNGNGEEAPLCVGEDGRASLEMGLAVYASHFSGRKTPLPLDPPEHPLVALKSQART